MGKGKRETCCAAVGVRLCIRIQNAAAHPHQGGGQSAGMQARARPVQHEGATAAAIDPPAAPAKQRHRPRSALHDSPAPSPDSAGARLPTYTFVLVGSARSRIYVGWGKVGQQTVHKAGRVRQTMQARH